MHFFTCAMFSNWLFIVFVYKDNLFDYCNVYFYTREVHHPCSISTLFATIHTTFNNIHYLYAYAWNIYVKNKSFNKWFSSGRLSNTITGLFGTTNIGFNTVRWRYRFCTIRCNVSVFFKFKIKKKEKTCIFCYFSAQGFEVNFPRNFTCDNCTLRLLRQADEWSSNYRFWSCADIDIKPRNYSFILLNRIFVNM